MNPVTRILLAVLVVGICHADVVITPQSVTGTAFSGSSWASSLSNSDLINAGQPTLASATVSACHTSFTTVGINDGSSNDTTAATNTFFACSPNNFPAIATYNLSLASNTRGYNITSIQSLMGWLTYSKAQANQTYTVEVRRVGSASYTNLATVSYTPFTDVNNANHESRVVITEGGTGILASGVDSIRFTFSNPLSSVANSTGTVEGTVIRELDVMGTATAAFTWDGGASSDTNWQSAGNWQNDVAPTAGMELHFAGSTQSTNNNDFSAGTAFGQIIFDAGAAAFTLGGNAITLLGDISNNSSNLQTINLAMTVSGPRTINVGTPGMVLGAALTGSGSLTSSGSGTLVLSGNNGTYAGAVAVAAGGTLKAGSANALPATTLTLTGILDVNNYNLTLGTLTGAGTITSSSAGNPVLTVGNTSDSSFSGVLQNGTASSLGLTKEGSGTLSLTAVNTLSGPVTVNGGTLKLGTGSNNSNWYPGKPSITINNGGTLTFSGFNVFGNTLAAMPAVTVNSGGTLLSSGAAAGLVTVFNNLTLNNGTVSINKADAYSATWGTLGLGGTTTATGNSVINAISGGNGTIANANGLTPTLTIQTPAASDQLTISAVIGPIGGNPLALIKNGGGTLTLNASNNYSGNTVVNGGTLHLAAGAQLTFVLAPNGVSNSISGAGTAIIDGNFVINTAATASITNGTWTLENVTSLTGAYGATFSVVGFTDAGGNKWTRVDGSCTYTFDESTGVLSLAPTVAPPELNLATSSSQVDNAYVSEVIGSDLVNNGQSSLSSFSSSVAPQFGAGGQNDGIYSLTSSSGGGGAYYSSSKLPSTLTFNLDIVTHPAGYEISAIQTFAAWKGGTQTVANQKYFVEYQPVGSSSWLLLRSVDYSPFATNNVTTPANTKITLTAPNGGLVATAVAALRFVLWLPTQSAGTNNGTVLQEIDVFGQAVGESPVTIMLNSPSARSIVQRSASNVGSIPISGSYFGTPDSIEARAVVMTGTNNSGATTDWQTIVAAPSGGTFTGVLTDVSAGGWYQIEVRSVTGDSPGVATVRDKIGVGDIYITAGQSNSTNYGNPAYTPTDDRVGVRSGLTGSSWRHAYDPLPAPDGSSKGSVWSRLGDQLAAADHIPIGFLCAGWGGTNTSQWTPGTSNYTNLKAAIQSFPANGFRAVLWHQGESDSIVNVSAATHASRLASIIAQSRTDAGWSLPWYLAEVSYHPETHLTQEEPVAAGQRAAVYADPLVFLGPSTDGFHLEDASGGKLADTVHFNAAGLADHSNQWCQILRGTVAPALRNGDFEDNRNASITGLAALADAASHIVNISSDKDSPSVLGWRILSANGVSAADGSNGFHNPSAGTYAAAIDSSNNGVMLNMAGRHVAVLDGGSANNYFLHTTRANAQPNTAYTVNAAIGVRDISSTFGDARIDLLVDGQVAATATYTKAALDSLSGGDASGSFTQVALNYVTGPTVTANQSLAVRIAKIGGASTVLDFDNVRLSTQTGYGAFQIRFWGDTNNPAAAPTLDSDGDGSNNIQEYAFGTDPLSSSSGPIIYANGVVTSHGQPVTRFTNTENGVDFRAVFGRRKDYLAAGLTYTVQFSVDMATGSWVDSSATPEVLASDAEIDAVSVPYPLPIPTLQGLEKPRFFRVGVTSNS